MNNILVLLWGNEKARDKKALDILQSKKFDHIILSGTRKEDNISKHALQKYISKWQLWIDRKSWDSFSNIRDTHKILCKHHLNNKNTHIHIITNPQHFQRIFSIFSMHILWIPLFPKYLVTNIPSQEKTSPTEKKLWKLYHSSFCILCWSFYTYLTRKF